MAVLNEFISIWKLRINCTWSFLLTLRGLRLQVFQPLNKTTGPGLPYLPRFYKTGISQVQTQKQNTYGHGRELESSGWTRPGMKKQEIIGPDRSGSDKNDSRTTLPCMFTRYCNHWSQKYKFFQFLSIVNFNILASDKTQPIKNQIDEQTNLGLI